MNLRTFMPLRFLLRALVGSMLPLAWVLLSGFVSFTYAQDLNREQALLALSDADPVTRFAGVLRLSEVGEMGDSAELVKRLRDEDLKVRDLAAPVLGQIWGRSGDAKIDQQMRHGYELIQTWQFAEALQVFDTIIEAQPAFAEGWNKRATVLFLMGDFERSLADCEEVLRRNPLHFGALSGAGQIEMELGRLEKAQAYFQRALVINPNMNLPAFRIQQIQELLKVRRANTI